MSIKEEEEEEDGGKGTVRVNILIIIGEGVQKVCYFKSSQAVTARPSVKVGW